MSIEAEVANQIAHRERMAKALERTGGEIFHAGHYDLREAIRIAVLRAIDDTCKDMGLPLMGDGELPNLFNALDPISERVFLKSMGL